ncbi:uncharacterized [Tachysurus ichikawai]
MFLYYKSQQREFETAASTGDTKGPKELLNHDGARIEPSDGMSDDRSSGKRNGVKDMNVAPTRRLNHSKDKKEAARCVQEDVQIKELINSDPRACHQPIEILSRSRAERPEERTGDGEASALKIRHENPCRWCVRALAYG